jgi:alkylation response protein AidB-like acyl-CoA dehydrogenase
VELDTRLELVLKIARDAAAEVDAAATFPDAAVDALRASGLFGLALPVESGGLGAGPMDFAEVLAALAAACGSTAMVYLMHVSAAMTVAAGPPRDHPGLLTDLAAGRALGTLAFSERGSRSHFWAPVSRAAPEGNAVRIKADKSWVTSAGNADIYVVSTLTADGGPTDIDLYAIPRGTDGLTVAGPWRGMGMRGNDSAPMAVDVLVGAGLRIGELGGGFGIMMETVLPWFNLGNAAVSVGLAAAAVDAAISHASAARFEHFGSTLAELPTIRAQLAKMSVELASQRSYLRTAAESIADPDDATVLHVLGVKAAANDAALAITDAAMRVCGGAAFSRHLQLERFFRDARAGSVMAPTADALYDFYGKAVTGQPLF